MVWCGEVWCGVVWCAEVWLWCDVVWCVLWCGAMWCSTQPECWRLIPTDKAVTNFGIRQKYRTRIWIEELKQYQ